MSTAASENPDEEENVDFRTPLLRNQATADIHGAEVTGSLTSGSSTTVAAQKWSHPPINRYRYFVVLFSFIIMGMSDGVVGALLPYLGVFYGVSYTIVSLVFTASCAGYFLAAMSNNLIHHHFGQRGVAAIAPLCKLIGYSLIANHPIFPLIPVVMIFPGFGNGLQDTGWNAWVGNMHNANELLGVLHGAYGLGAVVGPLIGTVIVTKTQLPWYTFYYIMIGLTILELVVNLAAFWYATGEVHRASLGTSHDAPNERKRSDTKTVLRNPVTWTIALFLLGYVGAEVSLGGWIVEFMLAVKHADPFLAGFAATIFWMGFALGRVLLGFITGRIGEKLAITIYLVTSTVLQIVYWRTHNLEASMVFVTLLGATMGPLFPAAIVATTKLLPSQYHVSAIGFAGASGQVGAAVFPFLVGAVAEERGVEVLQPIVLAIFVFILTMWSLLPGSLQKGGLEKARESEEPVGSEFVRLVNWVKTNMTYRR